jgi:hypothetical protein
MAAPIRIGKRGKIKNGEYAGYFVRADDDMENTGGYLVIIWAEDDPSIGFDYWVEHQHDLGEFFRESGWDVEWVE